MMDRLVNSAHRLLIAGGRNSGLALRLHPLLTADEREQATEERMGKTRMLCGEGCVLVHQSWVSASRRLLRLASREGRY